jgi:hypothetical protein
MVNGSLVIGFPDSYREVTGLLVTGCPDNYREVTGLLVTEDSSTEQNDIQMII